jgi:hypothetical protein
VRPPYDDQARTDFLTAANARVAAVVEAKVARLLHREG